MDVTHEFTKRFHPYFRMFLALTVTISFLGGGYLAYQNMADSNSPPEMACSVSDNQTSLQLSVNITDGEPVDADRLLIEVSDESASTTTEYEWGELSSTDNESVWSGDSVVLDNESLGVQSPEFSNSTVRLYWAQSDELDELMCIEN